MALRRIQKELVELSQTSLSNIDAAPVDDDNLLLWQGTITGSPLTPYKGGHFKFELEFPIDYPFKAPKVKFLTKIYHPNIDSDEGSICMALLKTEVWKPSVKIHAVLIALADLLDNPNPDDAIVGSIAEVYNTDQPRYIKTAKEWTKKYAS
ncbi:hypothetical protein K7432_003956 [Basidiobolus ranarum]|uniref:UBC core domain-containing protein n=1 Tax=Basidiobolus ranarum TaxID=34480 RepID=A0ABR2W5E6_9FUNG